MNTKNIILTIIIACQLMLVLDVSIMTTALPEIGRTFHLSTANLTWVQNAYVLAFGGLLLLGARAGDIIGRKGMFMAGIFLFTVASLLAGLAQSTELLLITRAMQGFAAAMATPSALALLSVSFTEAKERSKAIALYSAVNGAGGSIGLIVGGMLTDLVSWRIGMLVNVPIGIILMIMAPKYLPATEKNNGHFDIAGALTSVVGMSALVFGFVQAAAQGWSKASTLYSIGTGIILLVVFVLVEARVRQPITPLRLFTNYERIIGYLGRFLFVCGMFPLFFFLTQYLQIVLGFSSLQTGLAFLPMTSVQFAMMYVVPKLVTRYGNTKVLLGGITTVIIAMSLLTQISASSHYLTAMFVPMIILGIGAGVVFMPFTSLGLSNVEPRDAGAASGLVNVAHQTGASLGLALLITVFESASSSDLDTKSQFTHAISTSIVGSVVFAALSLLTVVVLSLLVRRQISSK